MTKPMLTRRLILSLGAVAAFVPGASFAEGETLHVAKSLTCGCCGAWVDHMRQAGFNVEVENLEYDALQALKARLGISPRHASCHTARIAGYVIEGHVPAPDVRRLLQDRPQGIGLTVPGMPIGSPGMEMGDEREPYDVVLIKPDGSGETFQAHH